MKRVPLRLTGWQQVITYPYKSEMQSICFSSSANAKDCSCIASHIQIMVSKGYIPLAAIQMAFSGQIYSRTGGQLQSF
jgi:hypothetical protein